MELKTNVLYYGDNLEILRHRDYFPDNSVDLIYLDPPFNSKKDYNILFKESDRWSEAQVIAFSDTWHWTPATEDAYREFLLKAPLKVGKLLEGMVDGYGSGGGWIGRNDVSAYLVMMAPRLQEMHRVLKPTGSLYLHCDSTASHYLKLVLDQIFGAKNFQNELLWCYQGRELAKTRWNRKHDVILFYTKSKKWTFNWMQVMEPLRQTSREALSRYEDEQGRKFILRYKEGGGFAPLEKEGSETYRQYVPEGVPPRDWMIIDYARKSERLGYETQKPLALLELLIKASSNEGDVVLDPFCGCGTALVAAQKLNRRWIGIDITHLAIAVMKNRLEGSFPGIQFEVVGEPVDLAGAHALARQDRYQFQWWAISLVKARPVSEERKKGADKGIDGFIPFLDDHAAKVRRAVLQVKSGHVGVKDIRELKDVASKEALGVFITLESPTRDMNVEALSAGQYHSPLYDRDYPKIQILTVEELLSGKTVNMPPAKPPFPKALRVSGIEGKQSSYL